MPPLLTTVLLALPLASAAPALLHQRATGAMTWYHPGLGACGEQDSEHDLVTAVSASLYDSLKPCGRSIKVTGPAGSVVVKVVDRCGGCAHDDLDLSPAAFKVAVGSLDIGRKDATWEWAE